MTVLHVLDHSIPLPSGYSFRSRSIVTFQRRLGLRPVVLTSPKHGTTPAAVEQHDGIRYHRTPPAPGSLSAVPFVRELVMMRRMAGRIEEVARTEGARVIHAHSPLLNGLPALRAGRRLGIPVVYEARAFWEDAAVEHGTYGPRSLRYRIGRALETSVFKRANAAVTICEGMRGDLVSRGVPAAKLFVVPNGVDTDWFQPAPKNPDVSRKLGLGDGPVFGFIGSFYHYEGLDLPLSAAPEIARRMPGARFLFVGGGPAAPELERRARELDGLVVMPGHVPHDRIRDMYAALDVFICPRRRSRLTELTTPLKPLEAMAMARTVLGSDVRGLAELIEPEVTGLLFTAESRDAFVEQAVRIGGDPAFRERLGQRARESMVADRPWQRIVAGYHRIYDAAQNRGGNN